MRTLILGTSPATVIGLPEGEGPGVTRVLQAVEAREQLALANEDFRFTPGALLQVTDDELAAAMQVVDDHPIGGVSDLHGPMRVAFPGLSGRKRWALLDLALVVCRP